MNKLFIGKIDVTKIDKARLFKGAKGVYCDLTVWFSEEPDEYGNNLSIQQSTKKGEPKIYLGSAKFYTPKEEPQGNGKFVKAGKATSVPEHIQEQQDALSDLPF